MKDVQEIIQSALDMYSQCTSYSDTGIVSQKREKANRAIKFKTVFERPNKFRFEFRKYHPYFGPSGPEWVSVVWSDGITHNLCATNRIKDYEDLRGPIAGATGISSSSAFLVPTLLIPNIFEDLPLWLKLQNAEILSNEECDEQTCYVIRGERKIHSEYTVWIDVQQFCIRKILSVSKMTGERAKEMRKEMQEMIESGKLPRGMPIPDFPVKDMITEFNYKNIRFNEPIDPALFAKNFPEIKFD